MSDNHTGKEPAKPNGNESKVPPDDELARKLRTPMLVALIFFVYAILSVLSTTDMMLLREGGIALPIIQSSVPVVEFYRITPLLLVVLHLHLLARLVIYARRIYDSKSSKKTLFKTHGWLSRYLIILFSFEQKSLVLDAKHGNLSRVFMFIAFTIIFVIIPLLVLLILQARFLAYQDEGITLYHQVLITLYLFLQLIFMRTFYNIFMSKKKLPLVPVLIVGIINVKRVKRVKRVIRVVLVGLMFLVSPLLFVWTVALVPGSPIEKTIISIGETIKFDLRRSIARCFFKDWWESHEPDLFQCDFLEFKRFINIQNETITLREPPPEIVGAIIRMGGGPTPKIPCQHVGKLKLNERHLLYANFSHSTFKCVDMEGAQLNDSILIRANLSTANLVDANLRRANLMEADLMEADLRGADLSEADLSEADLWGADLRKATLSTTIFVKANLRKADLRNADLSHADLYKADLSGADLRNTDLNQASLYKADLSGANLTWADLAGSFLRSANLSGADFSGAGLSGADLNGADLSSAVLTRANRADIRRAELTELGLDVDDLRGIGHDEFRNRVKRVVATRSDFLDRIQRPADLSGADLSEADLSEADLREADLRGAYLYRTDLRDSNLIGADLSGATMNLAMLNHTDLSNAKMYGVRLYEARIRDIILEGAKLYGANFSGSTLKDTSFGKADAAKSKGWIKILDNIELALEAAGFSKGEIDERLAVIKLSADSKLGYVLPTGTDHCDLYANKPPELLFLVPSECVVKLDDAN